MWRNYTFSPKHKLTPERKTTCKYNSTSQLYTSADPHLVPRLYLPPVTRKRYTLHLYDLCQLPINGEYAREMNVDMCKIFGFEDEIAS